VSHRGIRSATMTKRFTQDPYGPAFEWDINGEPRTYHAKFGLSFEERLRWQNENSAILTDQRKANAQSEAALAAVADDDPDAGQKLQDIATASVEGQMARFAREADQTFFLVADGDDALRESFNGCPLHLFQQLGTWLVQAVILRTVTDIEAVAGVPPTLPPPPTDSPDTTSGGLPSDDEELSSTG
jgi:hypothetical protein